MTHPVILYVATERRAAVLQREHDPNVLLVRCIGRCHGDRASSIIIETPYLIRSGQAGEVAMHQFAEWLEWVPTRLMPSSVKGSRITRL